MSSIKTQSTDVTQKDEVKARRATGQDQSLLGKSKELGSKALESVVDESRQLGHKVAVAGQKVWDAAAGAASKLVGDDKQAKEKDLPFDKPLEDVPVLHVNHKALDAQLKKLSVDDEEAQKRRNQADKEKITADQLHFSLQQPSGCAFSDSSVRSAPKLPSDIPSSSATISHKPDLNKAAEILGEKVPSSSATDASVISQFDQDVSVGTYNLQPAAPQMSEAETKEILELPDSVKQAQTSSASSSFSAQPPSDEQQFKQALSSAPVWEDIREAAQSIKDRQEEEREDAKEQNPMHQMKTIVQQAGHKVLETASSMYHAVSDKAAHMLHMDKSKDPAGSSSSKAQTRDAHDGAGPKTQGSQAEAQTGNVKDKGELNKASKSEKGEQDRARAMDEGQDAIQNVKEQGSQWGEEGKKRKREGEYENSTDAGAHDQHKIVDARNVKDITPGEPVQKQARSGQQLKSCDAKQAESLEAVVTGTLAECPVPQLDRQHSGSADTSHIPSSNLEKFNQQLKDAKPNEGRMLPATTDEQHVIDHQKMVTAPEMEFQKNAGGDERRKELLSPRQVEKSRQAHAKHKAEGTLPDGKAKTPEEAPRAPSEQQEFDPTAQQRLELVQDLEATGATKECMH